MKTVHLRKRTRAFDVLLNSRSIQAAVMTLKPGESTGEIQNEHPRSEQWLFVLSGTGVVRSPNRSVHVRPHALVLIEKGEPHQVVNRGRRQLTTINFYGPPAYSKSGEIKPEAKKR